MRGNVCYSTVTNVSATNVQLCNLVIGRYSGLIALVWGTWAPKLIYCQWLLRWFPVCTAHVSTLYCLWVSLHLIQMDVICCKLLSTLSMRHLKFVLQEVFNFYSYKVVEIIKWYQKVLSDITWWLQQLCSCKNQKSVGEWISNAS